MDTDTETEYVGEKGKGEYGRPGRKRGLGVSTATRIVLGGYYAAGAIAPIIIGSLATNYGWRGGRGFSGVMFAAIGIPLTLLYLKAPE